MAQMQGDWCGLELYVFVLFMSVILNARVELGVVVVKLLYLFILNYTDHELNDERRLNGKQLLPGLKDATCLGN